MRGRLPVNKKNIEKLSDLFFDKRYAQKVVSQEPMAAEEQMQQGQGSMMPGGLESRQPAQPLPNMVDRTHDIKEIIKNYEKLEKLVSSNRKMWDRMLQSSGQDTRGFLDDPNDWDDKKWSEAVKATERLVRDANNALMKTGETGMETEEALEEDFGNEEVEVIEEGEI